jgi:hypothetical protein
MTDTVLPLYLHQAEDRHLAALKAAKETLDLDVLVRPVTAQNGQYGRVLCFGGEHPTWLCESVLVTGPEMCGDTILWALGRKWIPFDDDNMKLSRWMRGELKEIVE